MKKVILILILSVVLLPGCEFRDMPHLFNSPVDNNVSEEPIRIPELYCKNGYCVFQ